MSANRSALVRGPGYGTVGSATTPGTTTNLIQFIDDTKIEEAQVTDILSVIHAGNIDETYRDLVIRLTGTPLAYTPSQATLMSFLFPFAGSVPLIGMSPFGGSDTPFIFLANNNDEYTIYNAGVIKPPDLVLAVDKPILGPLEIIGLIRNGFDPETANSYYKSNPGAGSWADPALLQSGDSVGRQRYYANWAAGNTASSTTDFTNFQGQTGITITHECLFEPVPVQGRTTDFALRSYRAMAKMIPIGPAQADLEACLTIQGTGAKHGRRLSSGVVGDLVITGQNNFSGTIKNAVLKSGGYVFGGVPLRNGEFGWVGTFNLTTAGSPTGGLNLS